MPIGSRRGNAIVQVTDRVIHNPIKTTEYVASALDQISQILISAHITSTKHHGFIELIGDFSSRCLIQIANDDVIASL